MLQPLSLSLISLYLQRMFFPAPEGKFGSTTGVLSQLHQSALNEVRQLLTHSLILSIVSMWIKDHGALKLIIIIHFD